MMRIQVECRTDPEVLVLRIVGRVAHPWANGLVKAWRAAIIPLLQGRNVQVDLTYVSFVDDFGKQILKSMHRRGCQLIGTGMLAEALVEECHALESTQGCGTKSYFPC